MDQPRLAVGRLHPRFEDVRSIAVLRGGGLGDVLFAVPAMRALAEAYPEAEITLLGTPLHAALFADRPGPVHRVEVLPYARGVRPGPEDPAAYAEFVARMRERRFDLGVQVHGGGRWSNPFLLELGARHTVGTRTPDAAPLERNLHYVYYQHEVLRALEVAGLAGAATAQLPPTLEVTEADRTEAAAVLGGEVLGGEVLAGEVPGGAPGESRRARVALHPGATDARRRWSVDRFAMLACWAAEDGAEVLVVGDASEAELARAVVRRACDVDLRAAARQARHEPAGAWGDDPGTDLGRVPALGDGPGVVRSVAGQVGIGGLVGLLAGCDVLVGNDSGPRHLAEAIGTPTVGIYWIGNAVMAGPLGRGEHRVHTGWVTHCPVCGTDVTQLGWTAPDCGHEFPLNDGVRPQDVYADVLGLLASRTRTA